jgi:ribosomal protein S18 acetylase RimI-like enzyme
MGTDIFKMKDKSRTRKVTGTDLVPVNELYRKTGYKHQASSNDLVYVHELENRIVGAVRISNEHNEYVLRGMQILPDYQRQGIGKEILRYLENHLRRLPTNCFCIPYSHLESFYQSIGFTKVEHGPHFLVDRLKQYKAEGLDVILMERQRTPHPRNWMAIETSEDFNANDCRMRSITEAEVSKLAVLMDAAYTGTIDDEGETIEQCADEMRGTITGKYGPFVAQASNFILVNEEAAAACLVTMWKDKPLIAFSMTNPKFQRQGLSGLLIKKAINELTGIGEKHLFLVVTEGNNSAQNLYRKIGFKDLGIAKPATPPPETF